MEGTDRLVEGADREEREGVHAEHDHGEESVEDTADQI